MEGVLLHGHRGQISCMLIEKLGLCPKVIWLPIARRETGGDEHVLDGDLVVGLDGLNEGREFAHVVVGSVGRWPMSMSSGGSTKLGAQE